MVKIQLRSAQATTGARINGCSVTILFGGMTAVHSTPEASTLWWYRRLVPGADLSCRTKLASRCGDFDSLSRIAAEQLRRNQQGNREHHHQRRRGGDRRAQLLAQAPGQDARPRLPIGAP